MSEVNHDKLHKLREPFPASAISKLPKGGAMLDFVGHANVTDRLLNCDPEWTWEPVAFDERGLPALDYDAQGKPVGLWIRLTVCGVSRLGYGTCEARKNEPVKELIGDAIRNAAMRFGVALELWSKAELESAHDHAENPQSAPSHQNGHRQAPVPNRPAQQAAAPQNGNNAGRAPKLTPMQKLMEKCERNQIALNNGQAVPKHLQNILKAENFSIVVTEENWEAAYNIIREHEERKMVPAGDFDDTDPFAAE